MLLYEVITGDVIVDSNSQEEGYKIVKSFLKDKSGQLEQLMSSLDNQLEGENIGKSTMNLIKKSLVYIFTKSVRKEPSKRIPIGEITESLNQVISLV